MKLASWVLTGQRLAAVCGYYLACAFLFPAVLPAFGQANLNNGLVAYYPFTGDVSDQTGNGNTAVNVNTLFTTDRFGLSNSAASFDGGSSYVLLNNRRFLDGSSNLTFSVWYRPNGGQSGQLIGSGDSRFGSDPISTRIGTGGFEDFGVTDAAAPGPPRTGLSGHPEVFKNQVWQQLVVVHSTGRSNSSTVAYLQGNPIATNTASKIITLSYDRNMQTRIGAADSPFFGNDQHWRGEIDDVRFYNRALSPAEVTQLYVAEAPVAVEPAAATVNYLNPVTFTATVNSNLPVGTLQWFLGTNAIPGAVGPTLAINSVQIGDAGNYSARYTTARGTFVSNPAKLSFVAITNTIVYDLIARMDGSQDTLIFQSGTLQWDHVSNGAGAPGRALGLNVPTTISSRLNGVQVMNQVDWIPTWPLPVPDDIRFDAVSSVFTNLTPALPANGILSISVTNVSARGSLTVTQVPDATNNQTLLVNYADGALGSGFVTGRVSIVSLVAPSGPPIIITPPADLNVLPGTNVTFTVGVSGPIPFTYQWRRNGYNLPGATNATLDLNNVQPGDEGAYAVLVSNGSGTTFSPAAFLTVLTPPVITSQPVNQQASAGDTVSLGVTNSGSAPFKYQWRFNGTDLPGAIASTLTLNAVTVVAAGNYTVVVSNLAGMTISSNATLIVHSAPVIITPPGARIISAARPVTFNVAVLGDAPFTYQWQLDGTDIVGATNATYSIGAVTPSHEGLYTVVVDNALGSATSSAARLTVLPVSVAVPWANAGGGSGSDVGNAIAVDAIGNSYVAGYFTGTATFGTNTLVSAGHTDIFIAKYASNGALLWVRRAGGPGYDAAKGIAVDAAGNCYVTGAYEGVAYFDGSTSLTNTSPTSYADLFLVKYDPTGNLVWARSAGVSYATDEGTAVAVDGTGNVLVTGRSALATFAGGPVANTGRIFMAKYNSAGTELWARKAGSYSGGSQDTGTGIAADSAGNVFVAGVFYSPIATFGSSTFTNRGFADVFLAKFDAAGNFLWANQAGGTGEDAAGGVAAAADGSAYLVGSVAGDATFSDSTVTNLAGASEDGYVTKYAADGSVMWVQQFGGTGPAAARGVVVDAAGIIHVTGYFSGSATFGTNTLGGIAGSYDAFVTRLDGDGNFAFAQQAGGPDLSGDFGLGIGADAAGNSFITGYFSGTSAIGGSALPSRGAEDVLVTRFNQFTGGGLPRLELLPMGPQFRMRWPAASSSYILQSTTNLLAPQWRDETNTLNFNGSQLETDVTPGSAVKFYRLRKP